MAHGWFGRRRAARVATRYCQGESWSQACLLLRAALTWRCECSAVTYGLALAEGCSLLDGPARVRD